MKRHLLTKKMSLFLPAEGVVKSVRDFSALIVTNIVFILTVASIPAQPFTTTSGGLMHGLYNYTVLVYIAL